MENLCITREKENISGRLKQTSIHFYSYFGERQRVFSNCLIFLMFKNS